MKSGNYMSIGGERKLEGQYLNERRGVTPGFYDRRETHT